MRRPPLEGFTSISVMDDPSIDFREYGKAAKRRRYQLDCSLCTSFSNGFKSAQDLSASASNRVDDLRAMVR